MQKILYEDSLGLCPSILSQFTPKMCAAAKNGKKFTKTSFGGSRSFKVIDVNKSEKSVVSPCYDKQHVYATVFTLTSQ